MHRRRGALVLDDTILDRPYSRHMELVRRHWSGKHWRIVDGIGDAAMDRWAPVHPDRLSHCRQAAGRNNDHFRDMLRTTYERGFTPECVLFDAWYSSLENLKAVRSYGWT